jgi:hypothetical protein
LPDGSAAWTVFTAVCILSSATAGPRSQAWYCWWQETGRGVGVAGRWLDDDVLLQPTASEA